ncbi:MAG: hypothetical protein GC190_09290 [Alphaproteobacteria bacterium]|nr:hypothetical protein [Alphaproteobacteria bacterium]
MKRRSWGKVGRLVYAVSDTGELTHVETVDILGSKAYSDVMQDAFKRAKFQIAQLGGKPVDFFDGIYEITFSFSGRNRARVHYFGFSRAYDAAKRRRAKGKFEESIAIVREAMTEELNMYELATLSHGLTYSYLGLNDKRRALIAIRHATIEQGYFLAHDARPYAEALLAQLEAENNNQGAALCAFGWLRQKYSSFQPDLQLQTLISTAHLQLSGTDEVRTDIELIDSDRPYVPNRWTHRLIRHTFKFDNVPAPGAARFRLVCPTVVREDGVTANRVWDVDPGEGDCMLYFYGDPGAKFTLIEK